MQFKTAIEYALWAGGAPFEVLASKVYRPRAAVLTYHSVHPDCWHPIVVSPDEFRSQMDMLSRRFVPVSLADIEAFIIDEKPLPKGAVAVTFDDAYLDNLTYALPVLEEFGIPATIFSTLLHIQQQDLVFEDGERRYMSRDEIAEISANRLIEIGGHGRHHSPFADCHPLDVELQPRECMDELSKICQSPQRYFAFPFGRLDSYDEHAKDSVKNAGYRLAFSNRFGFILSSDDPYELKRIQIGCHDDAFLLERKLKGGLQALELLEHGPGLALRKWWGERGK